MASSLLRLTYASKSWEINAGRGDGSERPARVKSPVGGLTDLKRPLLKRCIRKALYNCLVLQRLPDDLLKYLQVDRSCSVGPVRGPTLIFHELPEKKLWNACSHVFSPPFVREIDRNASLRISFRPLPEPDGRPPCQHGGELRRLRPCRSVVLQSQIIME